MLTIWGRKTSSNVQALMWCVGELGLPYKRHDIGGRFAGTDTEEFRRLNPNQTIPVLQDGTDPPLWETGSILRYLSNKYGSDDFWPTDLLQRTEVDKWSEWSKINIATAFTVPVFWRVVRVKKPDWNDEEIRHAVSKFEKMLNIAEIRLRNRMFLVGREFSLADIQFGHVLYRYFDIEIQRAKLPALSEYYKRLCDRPAYQEHVMISYDELRAN